MIYESTSLLRTINFWETLPSYVVNSCSINSFKTNIDKCWHSQDVYYDYKCDFAGLKTVYNLYSTVIQ